MTDRSFQTPTRRGLMLGLAASLVPLPLWASPAAVSAAITALFGARPLQEGALLLELPVLAETGNSVPLKVDCEAPGVTRLALFAEENPRPLICVVGFGPLAATARLETNIRMSSTQTIVAVAELADGRLIAARRLVRVVIGACTALPGRY